MITRSFLVLHEAIVSRQSNYRCASGAACTVAERGRRAMARPRQFALVLLCATATLAGWSAARLGGFDWSDIELTAASIWNRAAAPRAAAPLPLAMAAATTLHLKLPAPAVAHAAAPAADAAAVDPNPRQTGFDLPGAVSEELWKWIDAHEKELGVGRPYRDRDPPHVGPIDGKEYIAKRGLPIVRKAGL
jgi:hypothetical protein